MDVPATYPDTIYAIVRTCTITNTVTSVSTVISRATAEENVEWNTQADVGEPVSYRVETITGAKVAKLRALSMAIRNGDGGMDEARALHSCMIDVFLSDRAE